MEIDYTHGPGRPPKTTGLEQQRQLGKAIAQLYIASQHVDFNASNVACELIENASITAKIAFDAEMAKTKYGTRSVIGIVTQGHRTN